MSLPTPGDEPPRTDGAPGTRRRHVLGSPRRPDHRCPRRHHAPGPAPRRPPSTTAAQARSRRATPRRSGSGGAVTSVDPYASRIGLQVLKQGGNAVDAAVATAAALGVTEPYSSGLGGGGYFVYYDAKSKKVKTLDGRETAPAAMKHDAFIDPATGKPYTFTPDLVTSGVSVGVPGTPATWQAALDRWGSMSLADVAASRRRTWPAAASRSTRPSTRRPTTTPSGSTPSPRPASCSSDTARRPRSAACFATPTSPTPTTCSRSGAWPRSTAATWPASSPRPCASPR